MCTATWIQDADGYSLYFNRDELRNRQQALPPQGHTLDGVRYLAPTDRDAGGTWIAVNEHGLSLALLNDYSAKMPQPSDQFTSRGHLVTGLARAVDLETLKDHWLEIDLERFRPFNLLALAPKQTPRLFSWNGSQEQVHDSPAYPPLCSSSFDEPGAARARKELLDEYSARTDLDSRKRLLRYHQSHAPERGPYSVCMHRPDAVTVSLTLVEVDPAGVSMAYADGSPCSSPLEHLVTLERTR